MSASQPVSNASLAILDDYADIAAAHFEHIPNLKVSTFPKTLDPRKPHELEELVSRLEPFSIISAMRERTPLPANLIAKLPNLRLILTTGIRNASIDLNACKEHSIVVGGTTGWRPKTYDADGNPVHENPSELPPPPGYDSTTQHGWSLLLSLTSRIPIDNYRLQNSPSSWQSGFAIALGGKTLGLVGYGKLGANFARIAAAFGMKMIAWSASLTQEKADETTTGLGLAKGTVKVVSKEEVFADADVVSLHYVLSDRSRGMVSAQELAWMKKSALLLNTSRGPLIDEAALLETLNKGAIRGFASDVWWEEPLSAESPWRTTKWGEEGRSEVVRSPHMGYANEATMHSWYTEQADDVVRWMKGEVVKTRLGSLPPTFYVDR